MCNSLNEKLKKLNEVLDKKGFSTRLSENTSTIYFDNIEAHIQVKSSGELEVLEGLMSIQTSNDIDSIVDKVEELFSRV